MENDKKHTKKAQETRQKLLTATIEQIALKGYHNITVDEIAASCGLATGTAYRYFKNKTQMMVEALRFYYDKVAIMTDTTQDKLSQFESFEEALSYALDQFYILHKKFYGLHEELESLRHLDMDIKATYDSIILDAVEKLMGNCPDNLKKLPNLKERIYLAISVLENYAHLQIDEKSKVFDMEEMKKISLQLIMKIFED